MESMLDWRPDRYGVFAYLKCPQLFHLCLRPLGKAAENGVLARCQ
jgi:hypothetical protein